MSINTSARCRRLGEASDYSGHLCRAGIITLTVGGSHHSLSILARLGSRRAFSVDALKLGLDSETQ